MLTKCNFIEVQVPIKRDKRKKNIAELAKVFSGSSQSPHISQTSDNEISRVPLNDISNTPGIRSYVYVQLSRII